MSVMVEKADAEVDTARIDAVASNEAVVSDDEDAVNRKDAVAAAREGVADIERVASFEPDGDAETELVGVGTFDTVPATRVSEAEAVVLKALVVETLKEGLGVTEGDGVVE